MLQKINFLIAAADTVTVLNYTLLLLPVWLVLDFTLLYAKTPYSRAKWKQVLSIYTSAAKFGIVSIWIILMIYDLVSDFS